MHRLTLLLLAALLLPTAGHAQSGPGSRSEGDQPNAEAQIFLETFRFIRNYHLGEFNDSTLWEKAIQGLIEELDDPYATVFSPREVEEFREGTTGNYAGIGVQITGLNDAITITGVFGGTPADRAGLLVGDRIVGVDDDSTDGWSTGDVSDRIRGPVGTEVLVTVERDGIGAPIRHWLQRDSVHLSAVTATTLDGNVGYIRLDRVARGSAAEMDSALVLLEDARGIIIDLRGNPGGYLDESLGLADLFLEPGDTLLTTRGRTPGRWGTQDEEVARGRSPARVPDMPLVVLVDEYSASASEILAGALQDHDRALILGERTFGKGLVQSILPLPYGRQLRLTTAEWFTPLGRSLHRPRDRENRLLPEDPEALPTFTSAHGRALMGGGGVFPDLVVEDDTLTLRERDLLTAAADAEVPLAVRIQEFAFNEAQKYRDGAFPDRLPNDAFQSFVSELRKEGLPGELLEDLEVLDYLEWRTESTFFERGGVQGRALEVAAERIRVLARAMDLLREASSQTELFALAGTPIPGDETAGGPPGGTPDRRGYRSGS